MTVVAAAALATGTALGSDAPPPPTVHPVKARARPASPSAPRTIRMPARTRATAPPTPPAGRAAGEVVVDDLAIDHGEAPK